MRRKKLGMRNNVNFEQNDINFDDAKLNCQFTKINKKVAKIFWCMVYRPVHRILVGEVLYQAEVDFSGPSTNCYTLTNGRSRMGGAHSQIVNAQSALLGGSGGMPPQENFGF